MRSVLARTSSRRLSHQLSRVSMSTSVLWSFPMNLTAREETTPLME